ncbi:MAG: bifunctional DNA-formamidopyrimidine glycosylase/DNA-(apurinic or apyrimidinic site) lyase [Dehalococcoidia bacterium]
MPELPEVETIKNELSPCVVGQSFTQVTILDTALVPASSAEEFCHKLIGQTIQGLERRGKYLIFNLANQALIMHFRMTGVLLLNPKGFDRYARAAFRLSNGACLVFSDLRRFGVMRLVENADAVVGKLGPEPLSESFTPEVLARLLKKHRLPIKAALIDQGIIAGIGNMYADEALFAARIHPLRKAGALSAQEIQSLYRSIREVLCSAIGNKGASVDTYVRPGGQIGTAHFHFKVAHRSGELCPVCHTPIERVLVRNRGTYFCPNCQPASFGLLI